MGFNLKDKFSDLRKGKTNIPETTEDRKKKTNLKGILVVVGIFIFFVIIFSLGEHSSGKTETTQDKSGIQSPFEEAEVTYQEWMLESASKIKDAAEHAKENESSIKEIEKGQKEFRKEMQAMKKNMEENFKIIQEELSKPLTPSPNRTMPPNYNQEGTQKTQEPVGYPSEKKNGIRIFDKGSSEAEIDTAQEFTAFDYAQLISPSGSIARATLLTGVFATEGNSYPVLLEITSPLYETKREINDIVLYSFVIGDAVGDLSSSRVYLRLQSIALYLKDETVKTLPIKGWATDVRDGTYGVQGDVMQRDGAFLGLSLLASFIGGVGDAVSAAGRLTTTVPTGGGMYQTTQIDSTKIWEVAAASGISEAAGRLSDKYMDKAEQIKPVVCIEPGLVVDLLLINDLKDISIQTQQNRR